MYSTLSLLFSWERNTLGEPLRIRDTLGFPFEKGTLAVKAQILVTISRGFQNAVIRERPPLPFLLSWPSRHRLTYGPAPTSVPPNTLVKSSVPRRPRPPPRRLSHSPCLFLLMVFGHQLLPKRKNKSL